MSVCNKCVIGLLNLVCLLLSLAFCYNGMLSENYILNKEWQKNMSLYRDLIEKHTEVTKEDSLTPEIKLHLITPNCDLWNAADDESPFEDSPYFAFYWAGGQGLSRYILDHPEIVRGLRVLDVGSGCGATAIAAAIAGAKSVTANDIDPVCCLASDMNAQINKFNGSIKISNKNLIGKPITNWDVLFLGDMFYKNELAEGLWPWMRKYCRNGINIYIGDVGRVLLRAFAEDNELDYLEEYPLSNPTIAKQLGYTTTYVFKLMCPDNKTEDFTIRIGLHLRI